MKSTELRGYLTGLILGDGSIDKGVTKRAFRIKSINIDFIESIEKVLKETTNFKIEVRYFDASSKDGVNRKPYAELKVQAHPYFNKKYNFFYDDYRNRRITVESLRWLNSQGLANWFMSDGYTTLVGRKSGVIKDRRVELATDRYSEEDVNKIKKYLEETYGYTIKKVKRKEGVYRLRFSLLSAQHFFAMIEPYVVPSMRYKLNMCYEQQPKWMINEYYHLMNEIMKCGTPNK